MEETKYFKCAICGKPFLPDKQAYLLILGEFNKNEIGGFNFNEVKSSLTDNYVHFNCLHKEEKI